SAVAVDDAGASYLALDTYGVHGDAFTYALKVDAAGTEAWSEAVSGTSNIVIDSFWETSRSGIVTDWVGDIVVVARVQDHIPGPAEGAWIRKFAPYWQDLWAASFTADASWNARSAVAGDGSSGIYVAGITVAESYSDGDNLLDALVATF